MRRLAGLIAAVITLVTGGCATRANYEKILNSWVGAPVDNLVRSWGPPASSYRLQSGGQILVYDSRSSQTMMTPMQVQQAPGTFVGSTHYPGPTTVTGGQVYTIHRWCKTQFEVSEGGAVRNWRYEGNDCVARSPD